MNDGYNVSCRSLVKQIAMSKPGLVFGSLLLVVVLVSSLNLGPLPKPYHGNEIQLRTESGNGVRTLQHQRSSESALTAVSLTPSAKLQLLSSGTYEEIDSVEAVWQLPPAGTPTRGVLFVAHGCNHGAVDWWPQSKSCPQCIGLPEEMNITAHSLLRGYAVVAVSSAARRGSRCWQNVMFGGDSGFEVVDYGQPLGADWMRVQRVLEVLLPRLQLSALPLFGLGASSGGAFVLGLPLLMPRRFAGLGVQIMAGPMGLLSRYKSVHNTTAWPPTLFMHMPRDAHLAALVEHNVQEMKREGVQVAEIQIPPRPLTPHYLAQRCGPEVEPATSKAIYEALRAANYIDEHGLLTRNPREPHGWRDILAQAKVPGFEQLRLQPEVSPIAEELNLLYAGHELCSETTTDMLDWLETQQPRKQH